MACFSAGLTGPLPASFASAASAGVPGINRGMKKFTVTAAHSVAPKMISLRTIGCMAVAALRRCLEMRDDHQRRRQVRRGRGVRVAGVRPSGEPLRAELTPRGTVEQRD